MYRSPRQPAGAAARSASGSEARSRLVSFPQAVSLPPERTPYVPFGSSSYNKAARSGWLPRYRELVKLIAYCLTHFVAPPLSPPPPFSTFTSKCLLRTSTTVPCT